jgi:hypothetical protein
MPAEDGAARNFEQLDYRRALLDPERRCLLERRQSVAPAEGVELHMALLSRSGHGKTRTAKRAG